MRKFLLFLLCFITVFCTAGVFAATALTDVANTKYEEPVNMLTNIGLVNGYEDNTYKPDKVVTRAEMAKLMVVALGKEGEVETAKNNASKFSDVSSADWEVGYVNVAANAGIINGYPNGTFGSKNTVSYAEATAMIVRALGFEDAVSKSSDVWPLNYINQAKKLSLYSSIGTVTANDGAKRGNIAIMLWNMLRTGTAKVVGENSSGVVYSEGEKMINCYFSKYAYFSDVLFDDIDIDESADTAKVKLVGDTTVTISMDALEAAQKYGQRFDVLYNKNTKKIEYILESDENDTKTGNIESLTSTKIIISGGNSKGYSLPSKKNILLYGIDSIDDAVKATLVFDDSKLTYVIAYGPEKVTFALVLDSNITVSKKDGLEVINYKTSSSKKYVISDSKDMPERGDIILYYLNEDSELVILRSASITDAKTVKSASSKKITVGDKTYTLSSASECYIGQVSKKDLKSKTASSIEEGEDEAIFLEFGEAYYFAIYVGGTDAVEEALAEEIKTAKSNLNTYIKKAKDADEKLYTQETYANLMKSLSTAESVYGKTSSTLSSINSAYNDLKEQYSALKKISSLSSSKQKTETEIVNAKIELRKLVNGTTVTNIVKNKSTYTTASYKTFNTALTNANNVLAKTGATVSTVTSAQEKLETSISSLVNNEEDATRKAAINELNTALSNASKVGLASSYTEESYSNFKAIWDEVKKINTTTATINEITQGTTRLNNAMKLLAKNVDVAKTELNELIIEAENLADDKDKYTTASYTALTSAISSAKTVRDSSSATNESLNKAKNDLQEAIDGLVDIDKELSDLKKVANSRVEEISEALNMPEGNVTQKEAKLNALKEAVDAETKAFNSNKANLEKKILDAEEEASKTEAEWLELHITPFATMKEKLANAKATLKINNVTSAELAAAYKALNEAMV